MIKLWMATYSGVSPLGLCQFKEVKADTLLIQSIDDVVYLDLPKLSLLTLDCSHVSRDWCTVYGRAAVPESSLLNGGVLCLLSGSLTNVGLMHREIPSALPTDKPPDGCHNWQSAQSKGWQIPASLRHHVATIFGDNHRHSIVTGKVFGVKVSCFINLVIA